eukprot:4982370-Pleurochrysis_carterae.AAC.4
MNHGARPNRHQRAADCGQNESQSAQSVTPERTERDSRATERTERDSTALRRGEARGESQKSSHDANTRKMPDHVSHESALAVPG